MTLWGWLAAIVLFLQLPIPIYWFVVHPFGGRWRVGSNAPYVVGLLVSWPPVAACLAIWHGKIFRAERPPVAVIVAALVLIALESWIFWRVHRDLGGARLIGKTEVSGGGELARRGIYGRMRHPRYTGSLLAVAGACLLAGTRTAWAVAGVWAALMLAAISIEESELRKRFGESYEEYCRGVPRFIPLFRR